MSLKVLLLDDDETTIYLHKMMVKISHLSSDPIGLGDSKTAIDYLHEHYIAGGSFLLFLDINMPEVDGWSFLDSVQKKPFVNQLAVVIVTSSIDKVDRHRAYQYDQVIDYVEKPLTLEICDRIKHLPQINPLL